MVYRQALPLHTPSILEVRGMGNKVFSIRGSNRPRGSYRCRELNEELPSPYYSNGDP